MFRLRYLQDKSRALATSEESNRLKKKKKKERKNKQTSSRLILIYGPDKLLQFKSSFALTDKIKSRILYHHTVRTVKKWHAELESSTGTF